MTRATPDGADAPAGRHAWGVLGVLVVVYILNFIDRQILAILAEDIKADLRLSDTQIGFLYGTAFAVFYALFGIPLGRLADMWLRTRLLALGLALWSTMTALSGFANNFFVLAAARMGVGVGEASAAPCATSLLSDLFPKRQRATALAICVSGLYLGTGLSLFIGGAIVERWNSAYPHGGPLGLVGWQAAFLAVGLPGLLLALVVASLREPVRGAVDGGPTPNVVNPWPKFWTELASVVPPLTMIHLARLGGVRVLVRNMLAALVCGGVGWAIAQALFQLAASHGVTGTALAKVYQADLVQWWAVALGVYAVISWAQSIRLRDPATHALIWGTPAFLLVILCGGLISCTGYGWVFWAVPYAVREFGVPKAELGLMLGGLTAAMSALGVIGGGALADRAKRAHPSGRIVAIALAGIGPAPFAAVMFTTNSLTIFYLCAAPVYLLGAMWVGAAAATIQDLVRPHMRGAASAAFLLGSTLIGLSLGPYAIGKISVVTSSLQTGLLALLVLAPMTLMILIALWRVLPAAEATRDARARAAGDVYA